MRIKNARLFIEDHFEEGGIEFDEKIIDFGSHIIEGDIDAKGAYLIPGLIDIHSHAAVGEDASDGNVEGLKKLSAYYANEGVTSWCPTTMTLKEPELKAAMEAIASFKRPFNGAKICGINMEGPFVSAKKCGAQNPANIVSPDSGLFFRLNEASGGLIKLVTVACEEPKAIEFIKDVSRECTVSIGHTIADYECAKRAYDAGARHLTHLFNAMPSLLHRDPGVIAAAAEAGATAEIITDGIHVHPAAIRIAEQLFGKNLILISDSLRCAGMPDGDYTLGGLDITMKDGKATLTGTDTIAGSSIHLMEGLRRYVSFGFTLEKAVDSATAAAAKAIGEDARIGSIKKGLCADLVILNKDLYVEKVFINGNLISTKKG